MPVNRKSLFDPVVDDKKLSERFSRTRTWDGATSARQMVEEIYEQFEDPDGNFAEQFQTTGFDARYFELYLFAYFQRTGYQVDRTHANPDFLVTQDGLTVAVEATTVNPSQSGAMSEAGKQISELSAEELREYQRHELAIRFGSPLHSKAKKKYWELEHCHNIPFVIAIEAFHDDQSLFFSDNALSQYVYGLEQTGRWSRPGVLEVETATIDSHTVGKKTIPSNFFGQPGTEHISAVLFTNSGTSAKFSRMGFQSGYGCEVISMRRTGFCLNPDRDAMDPTLFSYSLDHPPLVETWGQGLVVLHNPNASQPIPPDYFRHAMQCYIEDGVFTSEGASWHPFTSHTSIVYLGPVKEKIPSPIRRSAAFAVAAITKSAFQSICGFAVPDSNPFGEEHGWYSDDTNSFLGVVVRDKTDDDWGYVVLARDSYFQFRMIEVESSLPTREKAVGDVQLRIAKLLDHPKRIFDQGDDVGPEVDQPE